LDLVILAAQLAVAGGCIYNYFNAKRTLRVMREHHQQHEELNRRLEAIRRLSDPMASADDDEAAALRRLVDH
jgi:hypothetical protein